MEKIENLFKYLFSPKNMTAVMTIIITVVLTIVAIKFLAIGKIHDVIDLWKSRKTNAEKLVELQKAKQAMEIAEKEEKGKIEKVPVKIYKSPRSDLPIESSSADFVSTVINMLAKTDNSIMDISYTIDSIGATEKANIPTGISVVQLVMTLDGTYTTFQDFIYTLYNYDYLTTIKSLKITPLQENKNILEINMVLWLYVTK